MLFEIKMLNPGHVFRFVNQEHDPDWEGAVCMVNGYGEDQVPAILLTDVGSWKAGKQFYPAGHQLIEYIDVARLVNDGFETKRKQLLKDHRDYVRRKNNLIEEDYERHGGYRQPKPAPQFPQYGYPR